MTQEKLHREVDALQATIWAMAKDGKISRDTASSLEEKFSGMALDLVKNQVQNSDVAPVANRFSDNVKKFAVTMNFYSPSAY